jgi:urease accessory protein
VAVIGAEHAWMSSSPPTAPPPVASSGRAGSGRANAWRAEAWLRFQRQGNRTTHQGGATAPLKLQRAFQQPSGHCELPLLHTAGGLVGGDQLQISAALEAGSRALLTSVAAQKVYGTVGRSRRQPRGSWAEQQLRFQLAAASDLEWLPQELVLYADGLFAQRLEVDLADGASFLAAEIVRLGRTADLEQLGAGRWRSSLSIRRQTPTGPRWELVDRLELAGAALQEENGMGEEPVFGSLVWAAPAPLDAEALASLLERGRAARAGLPGEMACGALEQGIVARYRGPSSQAARYWFSRLWRLSRELRGLAAPELPRVWPFQETPFAPAPPLWAVPPSRSRSA